MKKDYDYIFNNLLKLFPNPDTELRFSTPFQLLVAVMLSAQSTDKQVNKVTDSLFLDISTPKDISKLTIEELTQRVSSINYYKMKAQHIRKTAQAIEKISKKESLKTKKLTKNEQDCFEKYWYYLPESIEWLTKFPWVWEKTAKVILYVLYHHPIIAVDTHVHRVANRIGIVHTNEPLETSRKIEKAIPKKRKLIAHHALILFGRYYCTVKNPKCTNCLIQNQCDFFQRANNLNSN